MLFRLFKKRKEKTLQLVRIKILFSEDELASFTLSPETTAKLLLGGSFIFEIGGFDGKSFSGMTVKADD